MHLKHLKVFCDVANLRSFSRAARENSVSQPSVSQMVHQLEEHLKVQLIDRSRRPFLLTEEGKVFYQGCSKLIERYYALEERVRTLHKDIAGQVRVVSIYSAGMSHLNHYITRFLEQHPQARVRLEYHTPDRVYEMVRNDQAHLGLVSYPRRSRVIRVLPWRDESMVVVCNPDHPFGRLAQVTPAMLDGQKMVGFYSNLRIRRETDRFLAQHGVTAPIAMEFDNIEVLKKAVAINAGIALLPLPTVEREIQIGDLKALPIEGVDLKRRLGIIVRRGKGLGKTAQAFIRLLREQTPAATEDDSETAEAVASAVGIRLPAKSSTETPDSSATEPVESSATEPVESPATEPVDAETDAAERVPATVGET
jgi:DNA-binding transcriptional LysR family regulator